MAMTIKEFDKRLKKIEEAVKSIKGEQYKSVYFADAPFTDELRKELHDKGIIDEHTIVFIEDLDIYD